MRRYRESNRTNRCRSLSWRLVLCLVAVGGCLVTSKATQAAPITLRFNATIGNIYNAIPFDAGFDFALGDVIVGQFTFEPQPGDGNMVFESLQPYQFEFNINGSKFASPDYETESVNNSLIMDFSLASRIDSIRLGADNLQAMNPAEFPNIDPSHSYFQITLYAPDDAFAQASVPTDVTTWNKFNLWRSIEMSFGNGSGHTGFQAFIGAFTEVPEPSTITMTLIALIAVICEIPISSRQRSNSSLCLSLRG